MRICVFSDIHGDLVSAKKIQKKSKDADLVIFCGDITNFGKEIENTQLNSFSFNKNLLVIPGNHETDGMMKSLSQKKGWIYLHNHVWSFDNFNFCGCGGSPPTPFNTPFELDEKNINDVLSSFQKMKNVILITHSPPFKTPLDFTNSKVHVGSKSIRTFIEREQPLLNVCGHIHENEGKETLIGNTRVVCVGKQGKIIEV